MKRFVFTRSKDEREQIKDKREQEAHAGRQKQGVDGRVQAEALPAGFFPDHGISH
jgi:hypothetical protein